MREEGSVMTCVETIDTLKKIKEKNQVMKIEHFTSEAMVLGSVILDGSLFDTLCVKEKHFYYEAHKKIYQPMKRAAEKDEFIDLVVVTIYLGEAIKEVGGTIYLLKMAESVASTAILKLHERLMLEAYRNRETIGHSHIDTFPD